MVFISSVPPKRRLLLLLPLLNCTVSAQQSAAGQDTLIAIVGRDFVMMGADSSSSGGGGIALTSCDIDKLAVVHDGGCGVRFDDDAVDSLRQQAIVCGFAGDAADADRLIGTLRAHAQIRELEAGIGNDAVCVFDGKVKSQSALGTLPTAGLDSEAIAHLARGEIASRMRSSQPLQLCLLVGGMVRCNEPQIQSKLQVRKPSSFSERVQQQVITGAETYSGKIGQGEVAGKEQTSTSFIPSEEKQPKSNTLLVPKLFWLDQYGSLQNLNYGAHGFGSNFALSILDQRYKSNLSRDEAINLIRQCFEQLRQRYVINSPKKPRIKCVDAHGVREVGSHQPLRNPIESSN